MKTTTWWLCALAASAMAGAVSAQSRSSFLDGGTLSGISIVESNGGLTYDVTFNPGAQFHYAGDDFDITDVFGFWSLSDDDNLSASASDFFDGDGAEWDFGLMNGGMGGIAGWKTNPNTGITSGQTVQFNYDSLSVDLVEHLGMHIRLDGDFPGGNGNTGYAVFNLVPTPGAALLIGSAGLVTALRRRR